MKDTSKGILIGAVLGAVATIGLLVAFVATMGLNEASRGSRISASTNALSGRSGKEDLDRFAEITMPAARKADEKKRMREEIAKKGLLSVMGAEGGAGALANVFATSKDFGDDIGAALVGAAGVRLAEGAVEAAPARSRAWFPETFLFEPLVVTDATGAASVPVKVPDRLTSWRVLALAHSREGAQAGSVATFLGTLPTYVDPVMPPFLVVGDEVRLPLQIVNTTDTARTLPLRVEVQGARASGLPSQTAVPARGSRVEYATIKAEKAGTATLGVALGDADRIVRTIPIQPAGRPVEDHHSGTLAAPRDLVVHVPKEADGTLVRARLQVFPGAFALLRSELAAAPSRGGAAEDAYTLLLAGKADALLRSLGDAPDADRLRSMSLLAAQRAVRHGRSPDVATAALFTEGALAHEGNAVLMRLGERLASQVARAQRPDGTFEGGSGWTLQRLLVTTAECLRAVKAYSSTPAARQQATGAALRAGAAFERNADAVRDAYTAAALLAGGGLPASVADKLRQRVRESAKTHENGSQSIVPEDGVLRPDGWPATEAEATALAVLALDAKDDAGLRAVLGAFLLGYYTPSSGWGDGRTNLVALRAVLDLFRDPLPGRVQITLRADGRTVAEGTLDPTTVRDVMSLETETKSPGDARTWTVRAVPPVPGLGFSLDVKSWVPWTKETPQGGLDLAVKMDARALVGRPVDVDIEAAVPAGNAFILRFALPAGVQVEPRDLGVMVSDGKLASFRTEDGTVVMNAVAMEPGQTFVARLKAIPTLAGTLHAAASSIALEGRPETAFHVPSAVWMVR